MLCKKSSSKGKILTAVLLAALIVSALASTAPVNVSKGYVTDLPAVVRIGSPQNRVYSSNDITVSVSVESPRKDYWEMTSVAITVYLDSEIKSARITRQELSSEGRVFSYESVLNVEKAGFHSLHVHADIQYLSHHPTWPVSDFTGSGDSGVVDFRVETPLPTVTILSPGFQEAFNYSSVSLEFCVSKAFSWVGYSLDGQDNVTIAGNSTLTGLSSGTHEIVVYATDAAGQTGRSNIRHFSIATSMPTFPTPFPVIWIIVAIVTLIAIISFTLIAYFVRAKKRK